MDIDPEHIARLENQIQDLIVAIRRSRKIMLIGKMSAATGVVILASLLTGFAHFSPPTLIVGFALSLGGIVLSGSSKRTTDDLLSTLARAEKQLTSAIDHLSLKEVSDSEADQSTRETRSRELPKP